MPESHPLTWHAYFHAHKYLILLAATLSLLILRPVLATSYTWGMILDAVAALLVLGFLGLTGQWRSLAICTPLVIGATLTGWALYTTWQTAPVPQRHLYGGASLVLTILFLCYLSVLVLRDVFHDPARSWDNVYGALFVYFLVGLVFGNIFLVIHITHPNSFGLQRLRDDSVDPTVLMTESTDFIYYSFVTIATLGYGDIVPTTPLTRTLSWMEAVLGQFFLAVFVARLIAAQAPHRHPHHPGESEAQA